MKKRILALLCAALCVASAAYANLEYTLTLDTTANCVQTLQVPGANIILNVAGVEDNRARVMLTIEDTDPARAILLFRNTTDENVMKKSVPRTLFEKTYPGAKGARMVSGCRDIDSEREFVFPNEEIDMIEFNITPGETKHMTLPLYFAGYDAKKLAKSGSRGSEYTIGGEQTVSLRVKVRLWTRNEPRYVAKSREVEDYLRWVDNASICTNPNHAVSIKEQKEPYRQRLESLKSELGNILEEEGWREEDEPAIAYGELIARLDTVNLEAHYADCGHDVAPQPQKSSDELRAELERKRHIIQKEEKQNKPGKDVRTDNETGKEGGKESKESGKVGGDKNHKCSHCAKTANQIMHELDDTFQLMHNKKISKNDAVGKAKALYECYSRKTRKTTPEVDAKIKKFYNRIVK